MFSRYIFIQNEKKKKNGIVQSGVVKEGDASLKVCMRIFFIHILMGR